MINYYDYVKAHPEYYKQFSCKELLFLICECPPDFIRSEDWSDHNCFLYVMSGEQIIHSRQRSWHLQQGSTVFLKKGGCVIEKVEHTQLCSMLFYVPDSYIRSFTRENAPLSSHIDPSLVTSDLVMKIETDKVLEAFYESVISYFTTRIQPPENLLELKFRELLINIVANTSNKELTAYFHKLSLTNTDDLRDIMERNCLYDLQLHEYARLCHRSLSSFKRDFQSAYDMSPGRWLLEKRLEAAHHLLLTSDKSIIDVAMESGFKNTAHFSRTFKNHYGVPPLQCRRQLINAVLPQA